MTAAEAIENLKTCPLDMPVFVLKASDPFAVRSIEAWIEEAVKSRLVKTDKIMDAFAVYQQFTRYEPKKVPD